MSRSRAESRAWCPAGIALLPAWPALPGLGEALQSLWLPTCKLCHCPVATLFSSERVRVFRAALSPLQIWGIPPRTLRKIWVEGSPGLVSQWQKVSFVLRASARRGLTSPTVCVCGGEGGIPSGQEMRWSIAPPSTLPHPKKHRARSAAAPGPPSSFLSCIELGHLGVKFECLKRWMITCEE